MSNAKTDLFLDMYKRLEAAAERLVRPDSRGSVVMQLSRRREYADMREELDYCREVRNLLSHEVKVDGEYPVCPSDSMLSFMKRVLERVENPPRAIDRATPVNRLVTANRSDRLLPLMQIMQKRNLSHVPLLEDGRVRGIFSISTVFQAFLERESLHVDEETTLEAFDDYLPLSCHLGQSFLFIPEDILLAEASDIFDRAYQRDRKLKLLMLTRTGKEEERLLAVLSPYDVLDKD